MGYKRMEREDLYEIHRRWRAQHSISRIAEALGLDRKTVRQYIQRFLEAGLHQDGPEATKEALFELFAQILPSTERRKPAWQELSKFGQEIRDLVQDENGCWVEGDALEWGRLPPRVEVARTRTWGSIWRSLWQASSPSFPVTSMLSTTSLIRPWYFSKSSITSCVVFACRTLNPSA